MKLLFLLGAILLLSIPAFAQVQVDPIDTNPALVAQINSIDGQVKELRSKVETLPSKADIDSSFQQLDKKFSDSQSGISSSLIGALAFALVLNDMALICFFIIGRGKGWI